MATVIVKTKDEEVVRNYFKGLADRLRTPNIYQNPFKGAARTYRRGGELLGVVSIEPIYPPVWWVSFFFFPLAVLFHSVVLLVIGLVFLCIGILWHPLFYWFMLAAGLHKAGYAGHVRRVSAAKAWRWLLGAD